MTTGLEKGKGIATRPLGKTGVDVSILGLGGAAVNPDHKRGMVAYSLFGFEALTLNALKIVPVDS